MAGDDEDRGAEAPRKRKGKGKGKAAPAPQTAGEAAEGEAAEGETGKATLSKRAFVERVVARSGAKKKVVREVVEAALAEIGAALERGESLVLPPMGRMVVSRPASGKGATVVRFRRVAGGKGKGGAEGGDDTLAEPDEAG